MTAIHCHALTDIPAVDHWALIGSDVIEVPGYNRDDTNERKVIILYTAFLKKTEWLEAIRKLVAENKFSSYRAIEVKCPKLSIKIEIEEEDE